MTIPTVESLKKVLADNYALYLKTQNYHWNVEGSDFKVLHTLFEEQYIDLAAAIDKVAELIRGLGEKAPGTWKDYEALTSISDGDVNASSNGMLKDLLQDQDIIQGSLQEALSVAQEANDEVVIGVLVERLTAHRKNKWMLKSSI
ncbi:Dps family protein [Agarilytica rhodophyticola]|uniref:Dps family protein n=1 Tax=Agarilytica rhodophyticola TaxID=1737490 RepID=UPI001C1F8303|nr:DNA starvation/stationary phase protection protein [Agarilytica rhodophyticola]